MRCGGPWCGAPSCGAPSCGAPSRGGLRAAPGEPSGEEGSGSVAGVAVLLAVGLLAVGMIPLGSVLSVHQQLHGTADAAALAAADVLAGRIGGLPCEMARSIADRQHAELDSCAADDRGDVIVTVSATVSGIGLRATARAGPP